MTRKNAAGPEARRKVTVFGAGIAGLTAAHELALRGHEVSVYEAIDEAGGFFRSARLSQDECIPSEYSWHGFGPWYHNAFDILKQIPFDDTGSLYSKALSRPIDFGVFPDHGEAGFYDRGPLSIPSMFRMTKWDFVKWSWLMLKTWASNRRTEEFYATLNAAAAWQPLLTPKAGRTWRATFGPWIGSDWTRVSLHQAGQFFRKQLISKPSHRHDADEEGPAWSHGAGDGWLLLRGPSSEFWFRRWVTYLEKRGVRFFWKDPLFELEFDGRRIASARLKSGAGVEAEIYLLAVNPFSAAEIVSRSPALSVERELCKFRPLIQDGPHTQVSFRIAFSEPIAFPRERTAVVVADSEFNLTLFAQEQVWSAEVEMGKNVKSLWTGTSCVGTVPGRIYKRPVIECSKEQFLEEVKAQVLSCKSLDALIRQANGGRGIADFPVERIEIWHEWRFSSEGLQTFQRKWVNTTRTQDCLPGQVTSIPNLLVAGAHTRTAADVWSIEAAVESGRRAAQGVDPGIRIISQYKPWWLRVLGTVDDAFFSVGLPNVVDLLLIAILFSLALTLIAWIFR